MDESFATLRLAVPVMALSAFSLRMAPDAPMIRLPEVIAPVLLRFNTELGS